MNSNRTIGLDEGMKVIWNHFSQTYRLRWRIRIQIDSDHKMDLSLWDKHQQTCLRITKAYAVAVIRSFSSTL